MAARRRGAHAAAGRAQARLLRPRGCRPPAASVVACTPEAPCRRVGGAATGGAAEAAPPNGPEAAKNDRARRPIHGAPEPEEQAGWRRPRVGQPAGARLTLSDCDTRDTFSTLFHKSTLCSKSGGGVTGVVAAWRDLGLLRLRKKRLTVPRVMFRGRRAPPPATRAPRGPAPRSFRPCRAASAQSPLLLQQQQQQLLLLLLLLLRCGDAARAPACRIPRARSSDRSCVARLPPTPIA
jgi:hypothetical protein